MTHPFGERTLGEILIDRQYVDVADVDQAMTDGQGRLGERLIAMGKIDSEQLAQALSEQFGMPYKNLGEVQIDPILFEQISAHHAMKMNVLPLQQDDNVLEVAIDDPYDVNTSDRLERLTGKRIRLVISSANGIAEALERSHGSSGVLRDVSDAFRLIKELEDGAEQEISLDSLGEDSGPVVRLVNSLLIAALQKRASDVHIELHEGGLSVKYRIDGVLYPATDVLDRQHHAAVLTRLKVMAELDIAEKRLPQDGRFRLRLGGRDIDFRISILPSVFGEDVVIRILDKSALKVDTQRLNLGNLGMSADDLERFRRSIRDPYGMVLITGPTGSGKTTTLYAALSEIHTGEEKIITIEDPVEYRLDGIVQIPVNEKKQLTFARGLRSILRHDPDKIMIGEIRDTETAQIAVQSALTGHLVFTTVHANNALEVISRFSHMNIAVPDFVSSLNCVLAQRLLRRVCPQCKTEVASDNEMLEAAGLDRKAMEGATFYIGAGCDHCGGTGYHGRLAITEFVKFTPQLRGAVTERLPVSELVAIARKEGMETLRESAIKQWLAGNTTLHEVNRVTVFD